MRWVAILGGLFLAPVDTTALADDNVWEFSESVRSTISQDKDETEAGFSMQRIIPDKNIWTNVLNFELTLENLVANAFESSFHNPLEIGVETSFRATVRLRPASYLWGEIGYEIALASHEWASLESLGPGSYSRTMNEEYRGNQAVPLEFGWYLGTDRSVSVLQVLGIYSRKYTPTDPTNYSFPPGTTILGDDDQPLTFAGPAGSGPSFSDSLSAPTAASTWTVGIGFANFPAVLRMVGFSAGFYLFDEVESFGRVRWETAVSITPTQSSGTAGTVLSIGVSRTENVDDPELALFVRLRSGFQFRRPLTD